MIRRFTAALVVATTLSAPIAGPAAALDLSAMSPDETAAFGAAVRDYLVSNPLVLREAIEALQAAEAEQASAGDGQLVAANAEAIFDDDQSWIGGNPEGDVTLVEFLDYRCGYCRKAHPEVAELVASDGNLRKIVKEFPILGPESVEASRFAIATLQLEGPEAYGALNDTLMSYNGAFTRDALAKLGREQGLDSDAIVARMDSDEVSRVIAENHQLAEALQISGTPTFVLGDTMLRGYVPLDGMREILADVRAE